MVRCGTLQCCIWLFAVRASQGSTVQHATDFHRGHGHAVPSKPIACASCSARDVMMVQLSRHLGRSDGSRPAIKTVGNTDALIGTEHSNSTSIHRLAGKLHRAQEYFAKHSVRDIVRRMCWVIFGIIGLIGTWFGIKWTIDCAAFDYHGSTKYRVLIGGFGVLLAWMCIGVLLFTHAVLFKGPFGPTEPEERCLTWIEAIYLCAQIMTTVGYGDYTPSRPPGQVFVSCFIVCAAVIAATLVGEVIKVFQNAGEERLDRKPIRREPTILGSFMLEFDTKAKRDLLFATLLFGLCIGLGTSFFHLHSEEGFSVWEAFYMSCITLSTVGFGQFVPKSNAGRLFATLWMVVGVAACGNLVVCFTNCFIRRGALLPSEEFGAELFAEMDADGSGRVDRCEFLRFELVRLGIASQTEIEGILHRFSKLQAGRNSLHIDHLQRIHSRRSARNLDQISRTGSQRSVFGIARAA